MKNLKISSLFFFLILSFLVISCAEEEVIVKETETETIILERGPNMPCYPTGGDIIHHITSEAHCNMYGHEWANGKCWACY